MKTKESNKTYPSWKRLLFYVACVAALGILNCLSTRASDHERLYPKVKSSFDMIYEEPQPILPGLTNFYGFNFRLTNAVLMNLAVRDYARVQNPENWKPVSVEPDIRLEDWMISNENWGVKKFTGER